MGLVKEGTFLAVSLVGGLVGCAVSAYIWVFVMNTHTPYLPVPTIDGNPLCGPVGQLLPSPLWNNLFLLTIFMVQHSFMVRGPVKKVLGLCLAEDKMRVAFVLAASICLFSLFIFWAPMPYKVWDVQQQQLRVVMYGVNMLCWAGVTYSLVSLDPFSLLGIKPLVEKLLRRKTDVHFVTTGVYGLIRHPTYTFLFLSFWITPSMSIGHVLFSMVMTLYTILAVAYFEEADLIKIIGPPYIKYMKTTPRYIPRLCPVVE